MNEPLSSWTLFSSKLDLHKVPNLILMKKCSTAQRFICKEVTSYKFHTLVKSLPLKFAKQLVKRGNGRKRFRTYPFLMYCIAANHVNIFCSIYYLTTFIGDMICHVLLETIMIDSLSWKKWSSIVWSQDFIFYFCNDKFWFSSFFSVLLR